MIHFVPLGMSHVKHAEHLIIITFTKSENRSVLCMAMHTHQSSGEKTTKKQKNDDEKVGGLLTQKRYYSDRDYGQRI